MRDYQRKSKYILPPDVYKQTLETIRGYSRMKEALQDILDESSFPSDGMPKSTLSSDPVHAKAARRETMQRRVDAIEAAFAIIPAEYREGIWRNIGQYDPKTGYLKRAPFPIDADRSTYGRWKSKVVYMVAVRLKIV